MSIMQRYDSGVWLGVAWGAVVLLSGCGGLEKGPAPNLPYTPEPPAPKAEKKMDTPKTLGPSTQVPIKVEPIASPEKQDATQGQALAPEAGKTEAASPETKKIDAPAPEAKSSEAPKADEKKPAEPAKVEPKK